MSNWYSVHIRKESIEELLPFLFEVGVSGTELLGDDLACIYLPSDVPLKDFCRRLEDEFACSIEKKSEICEEDWISLAQSDWRELEIGSFRIVPILRDSKENLTGDDSSSCQIFLAPGLGFGTGEHSTTRNVLRFLQDERLQGNVRTLLDVGTGSGILAIAAALHLHSEVTAIDVDADALENARCNAMNNSVSDQIHLSQTTIEGVQGGFDAVVANVYAEVLIDIRDDLRNRVNAGGALILSGIMDAKAAEVREAFTHQDFKLAREVSEESWTTIWYEKRQG